ncbi:P-loop containing nucleoside triphosphate hydrolase protein [Rhodofomes roseus]|uniref:P-loop containing nucleoside triphosphate hydrolase protein n=1 Tax=Rhodofomes roseus TaxID=34475 RepID=A0ABQ8KK66_9APHY|nr:P-loop containing nucleoside triphosphate hydrolase protein [Rhodofomes roseus]KAH9838293.1 P-loop containing nucleoside triphosphate hydrolase protein [Rhodofomes roseus]
MCSERLRFHPSIAVVDLQSDPSRMSGVISDAADTQLCAENDQVMIPEAALPESRPQIARYDMFFSQRTLRHELRKTHKPVTPKKKAIIVVKRLINSRGQLENTVMEIHQEALRNTLLAINRDVEGLELTARKPALEKDVFFFSYRQLETRRRELEQSNIPEDQETLEGIYAALRFIDEDLKDSIADFDVLIGQRQITYELLWALFRPNSYVHAYDTDIDQRYVACAKTLEYYESTQRGKWAEIECDIIIRDDLDLGLTRIKFEVDNFPGARSIFDLPIYPLEHYPDHDALYKAAVSRGKDYVGSNLHFYQHHGAGTVHISDPDDHGPTMLLMPGQERKDRGQTLQIQERIMVDVESFYEYQPHSKFIRHVYRRLDPTKLLEKDYLLCTPVLLGFCCATKAWGAFAIGRTTEIQWSDEPFDTLVLGDAQKSLISSLVMEHTSHSLGFDDVVAGKGRGLVGLLSGNPGCGKTLTAEAVAEFTHKPLYAVSAGELGTSPESTDIHLRRILRVGQRWNAVVLIDEADVFLRERDNIDISRNALVSIFLRQVEYHTGVLIFTTNLIKQIDVAFESRIHFCVQYPDLDYTSRKAIWQAFLLKAGVPDEEISRRFAKIPLNGRQIKNVVSTAKSIAWAEWKARRSSAQGPTASSEAPKLTPEHVYTVLNVMQDWRVAKSGRTPYLHLIVLGVAGIVCALGILVLWQCRALVSFFL